MKYLPLAFLAFAANLSSSELPARAELFTRAGSGQPMTIEISEYKFSLSETESDYVISGYGPKGSSIEHKLPHAEFQTSERLFAMRSHACNSSTIDLVIQIGPTKNADIVERDYYRVVFSTNLGSIITQFYDPSIAAVNAILPLQSVQGLTEVKTGMKIACNGTTPTVVKESRKD